MNYKTFYTFSNLCNNTTWFYLVPFLNEYFGKVAVNRSVAIFVRYYYNTTVSRNPVYCRHYTIGRSFNIQIGGCFDIHTVIKCNSIQFGISVFTKMSYYMTS